MNRGRHKKNNRTKEFYSISEIEAILTHELLALYEIYIAYTKDKTSHKIVIYEDYRATARIRIEGNALSKRIVDWYINDLRYANDFQAKVSAELRYNTASGYIYNLELVLGRKTIKLKYKKG